MRVVSPGVEEARPALRRSAYHQAMLRYVGCNADTHLLAAAVGDEIELRRGLVGLDMGDRAALGKVFVQAFNMARKIGPSTRKAVTRP